MDSGCEHLVSDDRCGLPAFGLVVWLSLTIATVKAALVILFFMHLLWDKPLNAIIILSSLIFVALFLGFTLMDAEGYREKLIYRSTVKASQPGALGTEVDE